MRVKNLWPQIAGDVYHIEGAAIDAKNAMIDHHIIPWHFEARPSHRMKARRMGQLGLPIIQANLEGVAPTRRRMNGPGVCPL